MISFLKTMKFSSLFLLACGAVVQVKDAQDGLKRVVKRYSHGVLLDVPLVDSTPSLRLTDAFAFGAPKIIGHFITIWMITYADKVIVNGMKSTLCISSLLYTSDIGRHTSILFLSNTKKDQDSIMVARYAWEHGSQRPNTHTYPISCPTCHVVQPWCPPTSVVRNEGESFTLQCISKARKNGMSTKCNGTYTIDARPPATLIDAPYVGTWYSYN